MVSRKKRRNETPPVRVRPISVQKQNSRLAALPPRQRFDLRAFNLGKSALGLLRDHTREPLGPKRLDALERRERRVEFGVLGFLIHEEPVVSGLSRCMRDFDLALIHCAAWYSVILTI